MKNNALVGEKPKGMLGWKFVRRLRGMQAEVYSTESGLRNTPQFLGVTGRGLI